MVADDERRGCLGRRLDAGQSWLIAVFCSLLHPTAARCSLLQLSAAYCGGWTGRRTAWTRRRSATPQLSAPHRPPGLARQRAGPNRRAGPANGPGLALLGAPAAAPAPHAAPAGFRLAAPSEVVLDPWAGRCCSAGRRTAGFVGPWRGLVVPTGTRMSSGTARCRHWADSLLAWARGPALTDAPAAPQSLLQQDDHYGPSRPAGRACPEDTEGITAAENAPPLWRGSTRRDGVRLRPGSTPLVILRPSP